MSDEKVTFPAPPYPHHGFMDESLESGGRCPLCDVLNPAAFKNWGFSQSMSGIPVCMRCAKVITDYMIGLREDCDDE